MQAKQATNPQKLNLRALQPIKYLDDGKYEEHFKKLDLVACKKDIATCLKDSKSWWPADYGHYGPLMVRLAWHSAGTYRTSDGRGGANTGNMRFNPHGSWPDNGNLDKARRILWPIKKKYGKSLSWGDLMILAGNVAMEDMGFKTFGFAGGRRDIWATEEDAYWGTDESFKGLAQNPSALEKPLGAIVMSLIYVNPEGPDGIPDPLLAAGHIRETFGRMAMNDEETVALVAGGHTFGKCHGAAPGGKHQGPNPGEADVEEQGFGWTSTFGTGKGKDTITSGLEGAWTTNPTKWDHGYFTNLFKYEWELTKGPGGANQWKPKDGPEEVPDAHDPNKKHQVMMLTTDLSLIKDPEYLKISKKFKDDPAAFADAFARAWYKLCHRDMGPHKRCLGTEVPPEQLWQDPIPEGNAKIDVKALKTACLAAASEKDLILAAWAAACTFRQTDFRGGANGARIRLEPQKSWAANKDAMPTVKKLEEVAKKCGSSVADAIVAGGCAAVEELAKKAGVTAVCEFKAGRGDATQDKTDVASFSVLEPTADAFRNYHATGPQMVDHAHLLALSAPEMGVLVAGMRAIGANGPGVDSKLGVLTKTPGTLDNSFFVNLCEMDVKWTKKGDNQYEATSMADGKPVWTASNADLCFGSNAELRAIAEHYGMSDMKEEFVKDFAKAFSKVMHNDMF